MTTSEKLARQKAVGDATVAAMKAYDEGLGRAPVLRTQSATVTPTKPNGVQTITKEKIAEILEISTDMLDDLILEKYAQETVTNAAEIDSPPAPPHILLEAKAYERIERLQAQHDANDRKLEAMRVLRKRYNGAPEPPEILLKWTK